MTGYIRVDIFQDYLMLSLIQFIHPSVLTARYRNDYVHSLEMILRWLWKLVFNFFNFELYGIRLQWVKRSSG